MKLLLLLKGAIPEEINWYQNAAIKKYRLKKKVQVKRNIVTWKNWYSMWDGRCGYFFIWLPNRWTHKKGKYKEMLREWVDRGLTDQVYKENTSAYVLNPDVGGEDLIFQVLWKRQRRKRGFSDQHIFCFINQTLSNWNDAHLLEIVKPIQSRNWFSIPHCCICAICFWCSSGLSSFGRLLIISQNYVWLVLLIRQPLAQFVAQYWSNTMDTKKCWVSRL